MRSALDRQIRITSPDCTSLTSATSNTHPARINPRHSSCIPAQNPISGQPVSSAGVHSRQPEASRESVRRELTSDPGKARISGCFPASNESPLPRLRLRRPPARSWKSCCLMLLRRSARRGRALGWIVVGGDNFLRTPSFTIHSDFGDSDFGFRISPKASAHHSRAAAPGRSDRARIRGC
jgi:hypothetical protein